MYVYITNGSIASGPMALPMNWRNISNFYLLSDPELKALGWYPYSFIPHEPTSSQTYNGTSLTIGETTVVEEQLLRNKTNQELTDTTNTKWQTIRTQRNSLLRETDWTQLTDSPLTGPQKTSFATYRQDLRDITTTYADPDLVVWPEMPSYPAS